MAARHLWFLLLSILPLLLLHVPLSGVLQLAFHDERHAHILLVPFISAGLIWLSRKKIFLDSRYCPVVGIPVLLMGFTLVSVLKFWSSSVRDSDSLSVAVLALTLVWIGGFVLSYGMRALHAAIFPALFFLLMIPIPQGILDKVVVALQKGSAGVTYFLFRLIGVPVFREGFRFLLPGVEIEIAKECSGIRSSLSLLISGIVAGHLFLQSRWRNVFFILLIPPIVIFKNAVRIVTISSLGVYVDREFLHGNLHKFGGLPFSALGLAILGSALYVLQKSERRSEWAAKGGLRL